MGAFRKGNEGEKPLHIRSEEVMKVTVMVMVMVVMVLPFARSSKTEEQED